MEHDLDVAQQIQQRREMIKAERESMQARDRLLADEDAELAAAQRAMARFLPKRSPPRVGDLVSALVAGLPQDDTDSKAKRKPDGLPTIIDMARTILRDAAARGHDGLDGTEITAQIRRIWWPAVRAEFITPQLWRAAKRNDLIKRGQRYLLPASPNEEGSALGAEPSQSNGAAETSA